VKESLSVIHEYEVFFLTQKKIFPDSIFFLECPEMIMRLGEKRFES
jgi:hypothetical protein